MQAMDTNILAGRFAGQKSPSLNFLYLDGSYAAHKAMNSLRTINKRESLNFLSYSRGVREDPVTWAWMKSVKV